MKIKYFLTLSFLLYMSIAFSDNIDILIFDVYSGTEDIWQRLRTKIEEKDTKQMFSFVPKRLLSTYSYDNKTYFTLKTKSWGNKIEVKLHFKKRSVMSHTSGADNLPEEFEFSGCFEEDSDEWNDWYESVSMDLINISRGLPLRKSYIKILTSTLGGTTLSSQIQNKLSHLPGIKGCIYLSFYSFGSLNDYSNNPLNTMWFELNKSNTPVKGQIDSYNLNYYSEQTSKTVQNIDYNLAVNDMLYHAAKILQKISLKLK